MRKKLYIILFLLASQTVGAQVSTERNYWDLLMTDVNVRFRYSLEHGAMVMVPRFGDQILQYQDEEIVFRGFFLPADATGSTIVLSYNPMEMCFFCTGSGIESVMELVPADGQQRQFGRLRTDNFIEVKGRLKLNSRDIMRLFYILEDAELIRIIE
jgi:hypothetical protein